MGQVLFGPVYLRGGVFTCMFVVDSFEDVFSLSVSFRYFVFSFTLYYSF